MVPGRSHGHSHGGKPSIREDGTQSTEELQNINIRAAFIHILGDTLCTLGLLIAAIVIKFRVSKTSSSLSSSAVGIVIRCVSGVNNSYHEFTR